MSLSYAEQKFVADGIAQDLRCDGRGREDYRPLSLQLGVVSQASGSARLRLGATDVLASVKAELGNPDTDRPDQGRLEFAVEISPSAGPEFEGRGGEELAADLSKALDRSCSGGSSDRQGAALDLKALCITEGKYCWVLYCDTLVLNADGNILDACSMAIKAALENTRIPKVDVLGGGEGEDDVGELEVSDDPGESARLDTTRVPILVTLTKVGRHYIVDATGDEESQMSSALSIAVDSISRICGVTKRGGAGLDPSVVAEMLSLARKKGRSLVAVVDAEIAQAETRFQG